MLQLGKVLNLIINKINFFKNYFTHIIFDICRIILLLVSEIDFTKDGNRTKNKSKNVNACP